jgi:aspartyl-tRNA(Asn)/glutamyl-tRNA(Gln) amidotransferase subunit A
MTDLHWLTAAAAARAIAARELSPVELTTALLQRIGRLDPKLNAFIRLDADAALAAARAAEAEIASGRRAGLCMGCRSASRTSSMSPACRRPAIRRS